MYFNTNADINKEVSQKILYFFDLFAIIEWWTDFPAVSEGIFGKIREKRKKLHALKGGICNEIHK